MSQPKLFEAPPNPKHGLQIGHVRAWRRHVVGEVKRLWNDGVPLRDICARLNITEPVVDHMLRGSIGSGIGPAVQPRRAYGRCQKEQLRALYELPG